MTAGSSRVRKVRTDVRHIYGLAKIVLSLFCPIPLTLRDIDRPLLLLSPLRPTMSYLAELRANPQKYRKSTHLSIFPHMNSSLGDLLDAEMKRSISADDGPSFRELYTVGNVSLRVSIIGAMSHISAVEHRL